MTSAQMILQSRLPGDYQPDIDGLRAVAVLAVIFFHLDKALLPGGFVGVDIFFVISGFLITRNIVREIESRSFSLLEFYRRRVKRIAPAMLVVVAVTLLFAQALMLPDDARSTAKSAVASVASLANVYFWLYTDNSYFAVNTEELPLLHLWSLGVEEQFYLFWPLALLLLYRPMRAGRFAVAMLVVAFGSFGLAQALVPAFPTFSYYMLPTRAGELAVGALVAIGTTRHIETKCPDFLVAPLALAGVLMIAGSLFLLNERLTFPGWLAMPPTVGTALVIFAGRCGSNAVSRILSAKGAVWVGLLSYSAYLWHWPLLTLYRYGYGNVRWPEGLVLFGLTLLLAWLSYRFVELPARQSKAPALPLIARQYVLPGSLIALLALCTVYPLPTGLLTLHGDRYRQRLLALRDETDSALMFDWTCQRQRVTSDDVADPRCVLGAGASAEPRAILWGDSNAAHYIGMVEVFAKEVGFRFRNLEVGACPPLLSDAQRFVDLKRRLDCRRSIDVIGPALDRFPVVIMAASWSVYAGRSADFLPTLFDTVRALASKGKLVILIGKAPDFQGYDRQCREKSLTYPFLECPHPVVPLAEGIARVNDALRGFAEQTTNVRYFEITGYLCPDNRCRAFSADGRPRYYDRSHFTAVESVELGKEIIAREGIPAAFRSIPLWHAASSSSRVRSAVPRL